MRIRYSRSVSLMVAVSLAVGLGALSGCGSQEETGDEAELLEQRSRHVAAAWKESDAAAAWRAGYYPMGQVVRLPQGGWLSQVDRRAYQNRNFVLKGNLPTTRPGDGRVVWTGGGSLTRPLVEADQAYKVLAGTRVDESPHLAVKGAKLGKMRVFTSRGWAVVPAWLFRLEGYDSPLKLAAVTPSQLPRSPIGRAHGVPGYAFDGLVRVAANGRSVTVVSLHGDCDDGPVVDVLETREIVVLSASVKNSGQDGYCTKVGKLQQVTVKLDRPLDDRVLLDAHTGKPVLQPQILVM